MKQILGRPLNHWIKSCPQIENLIQNRETCWFNNNTQGFEDCRKNLSLSSHDLMDASHRLNRFRPFIRIAFPETERRKGQIESRLMEAPMMKQALAQRYKKELPGKFFVKLDSHLPISGSIKARGGIYEILKHAETLAIKHGKLNMDEDYSILATEKFRSFFSRFSVAVGSTGNLGLSIGIISASLGFKVTVHMSADARPWKKELLKSRGVIVKEYEDDYSAAVAGGRKEAEKDPDCHFVDDENSTDLFLGYAVAALRLGRQLEMKGITVNKENPLFVYLPCGVGGAPGGVAFGLKFVFGDAVHCFFAEPTHSPAMFLGMCTGLHDGVSVQDFGIDNRTAADGLAVGRPSGFVGKMMAPLIDGVYTTSDEELFALLTLMERREHISLEPSAMAGFPGITRVLGASSYLEQHNLAGKMGNAVHIAWATGGSMVPGMEMESYLEHGSRILRWE